MFNSWNQVFRIIGFLGGSPNVKPAWCWDQREGQLIWPYYVFSVIRHSGFIVINIVFPF
jgi:hypothetical protein